MATAAAVSYEVRYRVLGSDTAWSDIQTFAAGDELKLAGLDRTKQYEVEARAVSRCGARSLWANQAVTVADAQQQVAQQNMSPTTVGGVRSVWIGLTISYTATINTITINASAARLQAGDFYVDYNASSTGGATSAPGQTYTYWLYLDDPHYAGGSRPLNTSASYEDLAAVPGRIFVGTCTVTFPTSGSSSGGGVGGGGGPGAGSCVTCDSLLPDGRRAGDIRVGDVMQLADDQTLEPAQGVVTFSQAAEVACVEVVTESGASLRCSTTAPIPTRAGLLLAPLIGGQEVAVLAGGSTRWERVTSVRCIGLQWVQHITVGDRCFWAGADAAAGYLLHHNAKQAL